MKKLNLLFLILFLGVGFMINMPQTSEAKGADMVYCLSSPTGFKMTNRGIYDDASDDISFITSVICNDSAYHWTFSGNGQTYITPGNQFPAGIVTPTELNCDSSTVSLKVYLTNGTFTNTVTQTINVNCPL